eukprot:CAMPEP_0115183520 /NCGR_PEP_ID=MMETSP0270-20121206/8495_1 /TAXON_ID=71861 /ORGANISM="Scrippsiella trochoidea, Strain CCMP3099" /LENGTH=259 /DNA_ID=CAMNT_0002596589 /DNA_START=52 /DNA_END=828 /DNA_ORIENTATION=+
MSAQLTIVGGDATKPHCGKGHKVICHICNDMGSWGKGFVMALKETFPKDNLDRYYRRWHKARASDRRQQLKEGPFSAIAVPMASSPPCPKVSAGVAEGEMPTETVVGMRGEAALVAAAAVAAVEAPESVAEESIQPEVVAALLEAEEVAVEETKPWQEPFRLGAVQFLPTSTHLIEVANMIAQKGIKSRRRGETFDKLDYVALQEALDKVGRFAAAKAASVHMPRIGCGLAGGDWERIEQIVRKTLLEKHGVSVWVYSQ